MKFLNFIDKIKNKQKYTGFSEFFLRASDESKKQVLREAAIKANEEQMEVFKKTSVNA
ncbi:MAG: hypothetical protein ABIH21_04855 [Patescibacteria group bacterium]